MLKTFSERLKTCRTVSKLNAVQIVEHLNDCGIEFSTRQFSRWEKENIDANRILKSKAIELIVEMFNNNGLPDLSIEWLLHGEGMPPTQLSAVDMSNALDEEKAFYIARTMGENYLLTTISGSYAEPFASLGDQIITKKTPPAELENRIGFIKTKDYRLFLGLITNLNDSVKIDNIEHHVVINKSDIDYCGKLTWIG